MRSAHELNREELESVLKRISRMFAQQEITKVQFDKFAKTIDSARSQIDSMDEDEDEAEVHNSVG